MLLLAPLQSIASAVKSKPVSVEIKGKQYLFDVYEEETSTGKKKPGLILLPEFWGKDELASVPAKRIAAKGYVVLVADLYGGGRSSRKEKVADKLQEEAEEDELDGLVEIVSKAVTLLKAEANVDPQRIAGIGLGYGGGLIYNFAKSGRSGMKAIVSFYGGVKQLRTTSQIGELPALLYIRPDADVYTNEEEFRAFKNELAKKSAFKLEVLELKDTHYGFIHQSIEEYGGDEAKTFMYYEPKSAEKAWARVFEFLEKNLK